jgi:microcystin-dependent protein
MATSNYIKQGEVIRASDIISAFDEKADKSYVDANKAPINMTPSGTTASNTIPANSSNPLTTILQTIINNLRWIFNNNLRNVANVIYPIGSIYMSVNSTNPGTLFGGTWTAWSQGRVPVGVNNSGTFQTVESTGGSETVTLTTAQMPNHNHTQVSHTHTDHIGHFGGAEENANSPPYDGCFTRNTTAWNVGNAPGSSGRTTNLIGVYFTATHSSAVPMISYKGDGESHNNLPPYITCYFFKRTA